MNNTKKTLIISLLVIILFNIGIFLTKNNIFAGDIDGPGSVTATLYTLTDIYTRLTTNSTATEADHDLGPSATPASSGYTLTQIYDAIPTIDASKVVYGTSYLGISGTATTTVSTLCYDNTYYYNAISSCSENYACDSFFNGTYTADGIVVNEGTCETGDVCFNDPHYYSNMSSCDNNDPCDSDVAPTYSADGLVCSAVCVVNASLAGGEACCHNDNCDSGDCTDNVCATGFDDSGSVSGYAQLHYGSPGPVDYSNPVSTKNGTCDGGNYFEFLVSSYDAASSYYLYWKSGDQTIPTTNNPADWSGWSTNETTQKLTDSGTFSYTLESPYCYDTDYMTFEYNNTYFVVAKSSGGDYTIPVGVRIGDWYQ
jgi:hypothetical protein